LPPEADVVQKLNETLGRREVIDPRFAFFLYFAVHYELLYEVLDAPDRILRAEAKKPREDRGELWVVVRVFVA
jgi:hypothetical protein